MYFWLQNQRCSKSDGRVPRQGFNYFYNVLVMTSGCMSVTSGNMHKEAGGGQKSQQTDTYRNYCQGSKSKGLPQQAEVVQGVPGRLRSRIFLTFGTTRVVDRQPYSPAAFTPREISGTHFQRLSRQQGRRFCRQLRKKSPVTPPGIDSRTFRLVAQCLNHYATPGPIVKEIGCNNPKQQYFTELLTDRLIITVAEDLIQGDM